MSTKDTSLTTCGCGVIHPGECTRPAHGERDRYIVECEAEIETLEAQVAQLRAETIEEIAKLVDEYHEKVHGECWCPLLEQGPWIAADIRALKATEPQGGGVK